jgi:hypothetical protein
LKIARQFTTIAGEVIRAASVTVYVVLKPHLTRKPHLATDDTSP